MNCDTARALLLLHAGNDLPPDQAAGVDGHLAGCARCRAELAGIREDLAAVRRLAEGAGRESLPPGFVQDVFAAAARSQPPRPRDLLPRLPLAAAAVLAIVLIGALQFGGQLSRSGPRDAGPEAAGAFRWEAVSPELPPCLQEPVPLSEFRAPTTPGVVALLVRPDPERRPDAWILDQCTESRDLSAADAYPWHAQRLQRLIARAGAPERVFVAVCPLPGSDRGERRRLTRELSRLFQPAVPSPGGA